MQRIYKGTKTMTHELNILQFTCGIASPQSNQRLRSIEVFLRRPIRHAAGSSWQLIMRQQHGRCRAINRTKWSDGAISGIPGLHQNNELKLRKAYCISHVLQAPKQAVHQHEHFRNGLLGLTAGGAEPACSISFGS